MVVSSDMIKEIYRLVREAHEFTVLNNNALKEISKKIDRLVWKIEGK